MERKIKWRSFWLAALVALSVATLLPSFVAKDSLPYWYTDIFNKKVQYGLDLQGGLHIVYNVDLDKAVDDKSAELKRDMEAQLEELKITGRVTTPAVPIGAVSVILDDPKHVEEVIALVENDSDEVSIRDCPQNDVKARSVCYRVASDYADGIKDSALDQAIDTVRERINASGVSEPSVIRKGDEIIVELPGIDEEKIAEVKDLIKRTAKLEFKVVDNGSEFMKLIYAHVREDASGRAKELEITADDEAWDNEEKGRFMDYKLMASNRQVTMASREEAVKAECTNIEEFRGEQNVRCELSGRLVLINYLKELGEQDPSMKRDDDHSYGFELVTSREGEPYWRSYYLHRAVELAGTAVKNSYMYRNPTTNQPEVLIEFSRWGGRRWSDLTGKNVGRKIAVILDDKVNSAPQIIQQISGGSSSITMGGADPQKASKEAQDLVNVLRTGSLPAPLKIGRQSKVGALLGPDAVSKAQFAFLLGSILVILIMVTYYRFSGVISIFALVLNILFMLAILATFEATLTLPGIAALVLTVGMAVDANIIIYERIREELRSGKSVKGSVDAGFNRGFAAIIDGQLTTGIAGYILYTYGSGPIRGFAVMLMIGIVCTLFTATWVTRLFFEHYVGKGRKAPVISI